MGKYFNRIINKIVLDKNGKISFDNTDIRELTDTELKLVGGAGVFGEPKNQGKCVNFSGCTNEGRC